MVDRFGPSKEEATYKSSSKDSFKSVNGKNEAEMDATLSSDYTTAEPSLSQQPERDVWPEGRAGKYWPSNGIIVFEL
jgi:hypothetical protein